MKKPKLSTQDLKIIEVVSPPKKLLYISHPREHWYLEDKDPKCHQRILWLTRGIYLIEEWWKLHNISITYQITSHTQYCLQGLQELEKYIRILHQTIAPHQKIDQHEVVLGIGATQLLHAAIYAACIQHAEKKSGDNHLFLKPLYFTHQTPGYLDSKDSIETLRELNAVWIDYKDADKIPPHDLVEFVTTPNNPNAKILKPVTKAKYVIRDRVNHWPCYMTASNDEFLRDDLSADWLSVFSLAKILSFSGSRVGYAFVKDPQIAHNMRHYIIRDTHGVASDGEIHCLFALRYLFENDKLISYMNWLSLQLKKRWERLMEVIPKTELELINNQGPNAWVKTPSKAEDYLRKKYHVLATYGPEYGAEDVYARLNITCSNNEFEEFLKRLKNPDIIHQK